ncbi:hypothetical protein [Allosphingosinicella vermicomposti]|uniref:hypothetical protein n=1 Tax=Allosphingosinicella vermicomposti TaxID=614671 RepID=UPI000D105976|nr:hypothetical protein [Allosphingosinicella vermicomposti]
MKKYALALILTAGCLAPAGAAEAQAAAPSVGRLQAKLAEYFKPSRDILLYNWRGTGEGKDDWGMSRKISGARTTKRCVTVLDASIIVEKYNTNPVGYYGIDWAYLEVEKREGRSIFFYASHMADDEYGRLDLETEAEAQDIEATFRTLSAECRKP